MMTRADVFLIFDCCHASDLGRDSLFNSRSADCTATLLRIILTGSIGLLNIWQLLLQLTPDRLGNNHSRQP
jgi:hypothetical protein